MHFFLPSPPALHLGRRGLSRRSSPPLLPLLPPPPVPAEGSSPGPLSGPRGPRASKPPPPAEAKGTRFLSAWHRTQQRNSAKLLAPFMASGVALLRSRQEAAAGDYATALASLRVAGVNCYLYESDDLETLEQRVSALQEASPVTEVCTYRLVIKNIAVRDVDEPRKDEIYDMLADLQGLLRDVDMRLGQARSSGDAKGLLEAYDAALAGLEQLEKAVLSLITLEW